MTVKSYYIKKGGTEYAIDEFEYKKEGNSNVDTTEITLSRTYDSIFDIGDDVSIGYHDATDTFVAQFNGDITNKSVNEQLNLTMESYGGRIFRTDHITEVHENKTIEYIVEFLITNYTTLTYASSTITGITLERFVVNNETVGEAITRILKHLDWQIRTDNSANFYFEPKGTTSASVILTVGTNAFMESDWKRNPNRLANSCTVTGDKAKFNTNESFTATASQTDFTLTYKITGNVKVTVNGTEKTGGQSGSTGTYDYSIDREQKKVIFESGLSSGDAVVIYYEYELPIKVTARNESSISLYGIFPKKITDNTLKTVSDARKLAKKVVTTYGTPTTSGELFVKWTEDIDVGESVQIIDSFNNIDQTFVVISLTMDYPAGTKKIYVGVEELKLLDFNKNLDERLKKLETKLDNADVLQRYASFPENVNVVTKQGRVRTRIRNIAGDTMIWGNATYGEWGTAKWGSTANISFVLGNSGAAILGTSKLGSQSSNWSVQSVTNYNDIMYERFNFTTYKSANTTATWNTASEKVTFTAGQIAESESVELNNGTISKATLTSTESSGSFTYEMTADGTNWETVTNGTEHTFTNTGSDLRWRATENAAGTGEITQIKIEVTHT